MKHYLFILLPILFALSGCLTTETPMGERKLPGTRDRVRVTKVRPTGLGKLFLIKEHQEEELIEHESAWEKLVDLLQVAGKWMIFGGLALIVACVGIALAFQNRATQGFLGAGAVFGVILFAFGGGTYLLSNPWVFAGFMASVVLIVVFGTHFMFSHKDTSVVNGGKSLWDKIKNKIREGQEDERRTQI